MSLPARVRDRRAGVVGPGHPTYVIAEAGANHNRDMGIARELIDVAADAGADAVKFQTYSGATHLLAQDAAASSTSRASPTRRRRSCWRTSRCRASGRRRWPSTRASAASSSSPARSTTTPCDELDALDVPALKIASFEIVDLPLIRTAAATGRPLIISTGMAVLGEIEEALARGGGRRRRRGRR